MGPMSTISGTVYLVFRGQFTSRPKTQQNSGGVFHINKMSPVFPDPDPESLTSPLTGNSSAIVVASSGRILQTSLQKSG